GLLAGAVPDGQLMIAEQVEGQLGAHPTGPQEGDSHGASLAPRGQFLHSRLWLRAGGGAQWSPCLRGSADVEHSRPPPRQAWAFPPRSPPPLPPSSRVRPRTCGWPATTLRGAGTRPAPCCVISRPGRTRRSAPSARSSRSTPPTCC